MCLMKNFLTHGDGSCVSERFMKQDKATVNRELERILSVLVGKQIVATKRMCGTRYLYFDGPAEEECYLDLQCPWRFEKDGEIVVGSDDIALPGPGVSNEQWALNEPQGNLQDHLIGELLAASTESKLLVEQVHADSCGGFSITTPGNLILRVFPASRSEMEWRLAAPRTEPSVVYMDSRLHIIEPED